MYFAIIIVAAIIATGLGLIEININKPKIAKYLSNAFWFVVGVEWTALVFQIIDKVTE